MEGEDVAVVVVAADTMGAAEVASGMATGAVMITTGAVAAIAGDPVCELFSLLR